MVTINQTTCRSTVYIILVLKVQSQWKILVHCDLPNWDTKATVKLRQPRRPGFQPFQLQSPQQLRPDFVASTLLHSSPTRKNICKDIKLVECVQLPYTNSTYSLSALSYSNRSYKRTSCLFYREQDDLRKSGFRL